MKPILFVLLSILASSAAASEKIVFQAFPSQKGDEKLSKSEAAKVGILIKKVNNQYIWASREDKELIYTRSGIYHIFTAVRGSGLISIMDAGELPKSLKGEGSVIQYGEHIRTGIEVISYTGGAEFISP